MNDQESSSFPLLINSHNPRDYQILATIHSSPSSTTYKARYVKSDSILTIRVFHKYSTLEDKNNLNRSIVLAKRCVNHSNIIGVYCSFKHKDQLWVVMPFLDVEALSYIMNSSSFHTKISESQMAFILEQTLKGIKQLHEHGGVHGKIDLDHVFVDKGMNVKLDFSLLSHKNQEYSSRKRPLWMECDLKDGKKVDIWMFGLLAMELFYGKIPVSDPDEFMRLILRIKDSQRNLRAKSSNFLVKLLGACCPCAFSSLSQEMPSTMLGELIVLCLNQNPLRRPTATELLKHGFFIKRIKESKKSSRSKNSISLVKPLCSCFSSTCSSLCQEMVPAMLEEMIDLVLESVFDE